MADEYGETVKW